MNSTNPSKLSNCQAQAKEAMDHLRATLDNAKTSLEAMSKEERESLDADICLASRSAYFDFYTWVVLHGVIDEPAVRDLDELFQRCLNSMQPGKFKNSVQARYEEFKCKCDCVRKGITSPSASSI